jgi:hypothetical protein
MPDAKLFHGIAVVIDDEINEPTSEIAAIRAHIEKGGCPVVASETIPDRAGLEGYRGASFFVVDWNMYGAALAGPSGFPEATPTAELRKKNAADVIGFLQELKKVRFAPVFLFTQQSIIDDVKHELRKNPDLYDSEGRSHIFVRSKAEVLEKGVFVVLSEYLSQTPSAYVLKCWEREYERAKGELFLDFYGKSVFWPVFLWNTFEEDGLNPSVELGELIGRNLLSRMTPFDFDLRSLSQALKALVGNEENYRQMLLQVLEGERFVSRDQLHPGSISAGDIFKFHGDYFINIRPDCDCVARDGTQQDSVDLYLLEGSKLTPGQIKYDERHGLIQEKDTECIIFPMYGGVCVSFQFKNLHLKPWGEWKQRRIGRLLPPFLTRLQQRYSAYLQRPGLTRVPKQAVRLAENASKATAGSAIAPQSNHITHGSVDVAVSPGPAAERSSEPEIAPQSVSAQSERTLEIPAPPQDAAKGTATYVSEPVATKQPAAPQPKPTVEGPSQSTKPTDSTTSKSGGTSVSDDTKSS